MKPALQENSTRGRYGARKLSGLGVWLVCAGSLTANAAPISPVELALAVLPATQSPATDLLTGTYAVGPLVPGVNHAFGLESTDGTQRVSLPIFLEAIADLGTPARWNSRDADNPAARFPVDPAHRLDQSVEGALLGIVQDYRDAEQSHWADSAKAYFDLARMIGADPVGNANNPNRERLSVQAREQHRMLIRALRGALPTIERHVARIDDPERAGAERRRLLLQTAELRARMDELERQQPDPDPYRARIWAQLTQQQRQLATDGIVRRYLAQRLERDGLSAEQIRQTLRDAISGQTSEPASRATTMSPTENPAAAMMDSTGNADSMNAMGTANDMTTAMSRVDISAMGPVTTEVTADDVMNGMIDDALLSADERERLEQGHPGELQRRLEQLRRQTVRRVFGSDAENRRSAPEPPSVRDALADMAWFDVP